MRSCGKGTFPTCQETPNPGLKKWKTWICFCDFGGVTIVILLYFMPTWLHHCDSIFVLLPPQALYPCNTHSPPLVNDNKN